MAGSSRWVKAATIAKPKCARSRLQRLKPKCPRRSLPWSRSRGYRLIVCQVRELRRFHTHFPPVAGGCMLGQSDHEYVKHARGDRLAAVGLEKEQLRQTRRRGGRPPPRT